ncbi:type II secretion system protein GspC [Shewanella yunxiaonensis]|uniref:Type II secretion system protein GspC n=1 Tax=Shewanella yunxiaonensis TaxID=2829809 RepID=A0ABX7YV99_9GAMM|nr:MULTISPECIES: type II secretion system protein GspC [Shewanella]MDF0534578.1 type II secretion system protein GspC [Shewanella sp. A32]QUN06041.1 type II secretion system protein GspC [Shewanella yunxiaonensis]
MDSLDKIIAKVTAIPSKPASNAVFWLLLLLVLYLAAQITWKLIPVTTPPVAWKAAPMGQVQQQNIDLSAIKGLALFGKADATGAPVKATAPELITDAPKTSLSILLTGVVASTAQQRGLAVIESQGSQDTYSPGDKIKGTSASLKEVYADRIIITNAGRYETLMLDGLEFTTSSGDANEQLQQARSQPALKVDRRDANLGRDIQQSRDELIADPGKISDYLAISPVQQDGQMLGYRINPGKNPELFQKAGFKANDLAKAINGYDLTEMSQALDIMGQLSDLTDITVTVERDGQLVEIMFSLPQ